ncbi:hypothetical protein MARBORIA2_02250 [Methanobrevibacter arboriphilus]|jgi:hypothetical protein|uniref:MrcB family domain-containing protein n=1 Tax=Methanobrevibacter arboriphilus TaxID=39441 RepID=UPI0022EEBE10|nr:DUF3578 domain-containing protein [Methanobrevibacter arboriphilus]GLI11135.1 hypothetical protein MARBORIA2_02250 [Methanobrevibacter arboriphilus]
MQELIREILRKYPKDKSIKFEDRYNGIISEKALDSIKNSLGNDTDFDKYKIYGGCGLGSWADVPWIGIFDKKITEKATKGYYIVYLFDKEMDGVYLSLNQGWTWFRDEFGTKLGKENAAKVRYYWRKKIESPFNEWTAYDIYMKSKNTTPQGYEKCHILGKYYKKSEIPENEILKKDLLMLMGKYEELNNKLTLVDGKISIEETNKKILDIENYDKIAKENEKNTSSVIESNSGTDDYNFKPVKIDYKLRDEKNREIGLDGEIAVFNHEKKQLQELGLLDLVENIKHVSKEEGDGAGYDILSYDEDGNKKYIEVKTTEQNLDNPFIITDRELEFSKRNSENYSLYRVYNFDKNASLRFEEIKGDLTKSFNFKPTIYKSERI